MNSLKTLLLTKSVIAAAVTVASVAASGVASSATAGDSPEDGVACRVAPKSYTGSLTNNKFFCKRTLIHGQALTCSIPGFGTKFIREGSGGGGKDVCAAPGRVYPANVALTGTEHVDWEYAAAGPTQVSTIVANQRQFEATALGVALREVDAKALTSGVVINHTGSEDHLQVTIEFATYAIPALGGIVIGGPVVNSSTTPFVPRQLP